MLFLQSEYAVELPRTTGVVLFHFSVLVIFVLGSLLATGLLIRLWMLLGRHIELAKLQLAD